MPSSNSRIPLVSSERGYAIKHSAIQVSLFEETTLLLRQSSCRSLPSLLPGLQRRITRRLRARLYVART